MSRRTVIDSDDSLIIKGSLVIEGNVTQKQITEIVNEFESDTLEINSDGNANVATLQLTSFSDSANISYDSATGNVVFSHPISGTFTGNAAAANALTSAVTIALSGDATGSNTFINAGDTSTIPLTLATVNSNVGTFGDANTSITFTVNGKGLITAASQAAISIPSLQVSDFNTAISAYIIPGNAITESNGVISVPNTAVTPTAYGAADTLVAFTVDQQGRLTTATDTIIDITADQVSDFNTSIDAYVTGGDGIDYATGTISVDTTVARVAGDTYTGDLLLTGANILPTTSNVQTLGNATNQYEHVYANNITVGTLNIGPDGLTDIHDAFFVVANGALTYTHNVTGAYYGVNSGDGITTAANTVAVDSTVIRTTGDQSLANIKIFTGSVDMTAAIATASTQANTDNTTKVATTAYVTTKISDLIGGAPAALDTLREISDSLSNNTTLANTLIASIDGANTNINTNNVAISTLQGITFTAGNGLIGGGNLTTNRQFDIVGGTGITVIADSISTNDSAIVHDNLSGFVADEHVAHAGVILTAGDGLSGGGNISVSQSFAVDSTVIRTTGDQSLANVKTFTGTLITPTGTPTTEGAIYRDGTDAFMYVGGTARNLTIADVGQVEDVGATGLDIYAGSRSAANVTYHGIKSIVNSTYSTISEASNVITLDGNITAIRAAFSVTDAGGDGSLAYAAATGIFTYTGPSASEVRAHLSGTGLVGYDSGTGIITTTADNFASWKFTTDSAGNISVASGDLLSLAGGTNMTVSHAGNVITFTNDNSSDITGVTAGAGMTGGGSSGDVTLNVIGGDGITANADDIQVDSTVARTDVATETFAANVVLTAGTLTIGGTGSNYTDKLTLIAPHSAGIFEAGLEMHRSGQAAGTKIQALRNPSGGIGLAFYVTTNNTNEGTGTYTLAASLDETNDFAVVGDITANNLSGTNTGDEPTALTTAAGIIEIATQTETNAGADGLRAIVPLYLNGWNGGTVGSILKVGTIDTGVWQGTAINQTYLVGQSGTNTGDQTAGDGLSGTTTLAVDSTVVRTTGTQSIAGAKTFSDNLTTTAHHIASVGAAISAAGTVQGDATLLAADINNVTTVAANSGVIFPTAVAGMRLSVFNNGANDLDVYPATGAQVNALGANAPFILAVGAKLDYVATSATQWYTLNATFA